MSLPRVVMMANNIDEVGGAQRVAHVVAARLAGLGYPVELVGVTPYSPRHPFAVDPAYREIRLMGSPWPPPPPDNRPRTRLKPSVRRLLQERVDLRAEAVATLADVLRSGPPGVVITTQLWAMEHLAEVPHDDWAVIGQYHSSFESAASGRDLGRILSLYRDVDAMTMLSVEDSRSVQRAGLNNATWLPNPLPFWPEEPATATAPVITFLGRLSPEKAPLLLLDAWGRIASRHPEWRLRIVGSGPDERLVHARAKDVTEGSDRIDILPAVVDVEAELRGSGLFVLPSLTEGFGLALAEAMALGLPCVATDCSAGVRMVTRHGEAARLVSRGDAGALAEAMSELMSSPRERAELGAAGRRAMGEYRVERAVPRWESLISDVLR